MRFLALEKLLQNIWLVQSTFFHTRHFWSSCLHIIYPHTVFSAQDLLICLYLNRDLMETVQKLMLVERAWWMGRQIGEVGGEQEVLWVVYWHGKVVWKFVGDGMEREE